jgi:hypothetical protein
MDEGATRHFPLGERRLLFQCDPPNQAELQESLLEAVSAFSATTPSLPDRLRVGVDLALTILSYGGSGWIPQDWDHQKVMVLRSAQYGKGCSSPYFMYESVCVTLAQPPFDKVELYAKSVLLSLGIILLELTNKALLEGTTFWSKYCPAEGANEFTRYCAAVKWLEDVELNQPPNLSDPIKRCLTNHFSSDANLGDAAFLKEVFEGVVAPLESFIAGWNTPASAY